VNHLSENNLPNSFQSANVKSHLTETTLLSVHDYIVGAMSLQQLTCLCLLDQSAAFHIIDHSIILFFLSVSHHGLASVVLSCLGLNHILRIDLSMSILMALNDLCFSFSKVYLRDQSYGHFF
jgi:hypothetical protein